jgi:hypothetical protein
MAPSPHSASVSSRRECRRVICVFLACLGIGFALTGAAAWAVDAALSTGPNLRSKTPTRAAGIVIANNYSVVASATNDAPLVRVEPVKGRTFDAKLPVALASAPSPEDAVPSVAQKPADRTSNAASVQPDSPLTTQTISVPVPARPSHTAVYDIATHTVYLPNGHTLEAHSGLDSKLDDPRYVRVKDRGPTPPNVYELKLRDKLFHKVRAIRLIPAGDDNMFGRDGMLAHSYMRGASGESNGCVSFKNYSEFLSAYLKGEIDRLVVVTHISRANWHTASAVFGPQLLDTD